MPAALTQSAALAGAADTASFLVTRRKLFRDAPQRAFGSVAVLGLWVALAASSKSDRGGRSSGRTLALASLNAAGQFAMLGVHLRHRIAGPRVWLGAALGGAALCGALAQR
jgi:hypothetical protein